jgi:hypothetical protein
MMMMGTTTGKFARLLILGLLLLIAGTLGFVFWLFSDLFPADVSLFVGIAVFLLIIGAISYLALMQVKGGGG